MDFIVFKTRDMGILCLHWSSPTQHSSMGTTTLTHTQQSQVAHTVAYYKIGNTSQNVQHMQQYGFNNSKQ